MVHIYTVTYYYHILLGSLCSPHSSSSSTISSQWFLSFTISLNVVWTNIEFSRKLFQHTFQKCCKLQLKKCMEASRIQETKPCNTIRSKRFIFMLLPTFLAHPLQNLLVSHCRFFWSQEDFYSLGTHIYLYVLMHILIQTCMHIF